MPTYPHVTLACFDCKQVGSVPASDSSLPRRHLAPTQWSNWAASGPGVCVPSLRVTWNQVGSCTGSARQWLRPWQFRLRLQQAQSPPLSSGLHHMSYVVRQSLCLTPTVKKHVTYCGLICPSIKTNTVKIWSNKVKIWVNKVKIKYK